MAATALNGFLSFERLVELDETTPILLASITFEQAKIHLSISFNIVDVGDILLSAVTDPACVNFYFDASMLGNGISAQIMQAVFAAAEAWVNSFHFSMNQITGLTCSSEESAVSLSVGIDSYLPLEAGGIATIVEYVSQTMTSCSHLCLEDFRPTDFSICGVLPTHVTHFFIHFCDAPAGRGYAGLNTLLSGESLIELHLTLDLVDPNEIAVLILGLGGHKGLRVLDLDRCLELMTGDQPAIADEIGPSPTSNATVLVHALSYLLVTQRLPIVFISLGRNEGEWDRPVFTTTSWADELQRLFSVSEALEKVIVPGSDDCPCEFSRQTQAMLTMAPVPTEGAVLPDDSAPSPTN